MGTPGIGARRVRDGSFECCHPLQWREGLESVGGGTQGLDVLQAAARIRKAFGGQPAMAVVDVQALLEHAVQAPGKQAPAPVLAVEVQTVVVRVAVPIEVPDQRADRQEVHQVPFVQQGLVTA